jgi:hypothetical protein
LKLADREIKSLTRDLIAGLGQLRYLPAKDALRSFVFTDAKSRKEDEFGEDHQLRSAAFKALLRIEPQNKKRLLAEIVQGARCPNDIRELAIDEATRTDDIEYVKMLLPLFENVARTRGRGQRSQAVCAAEPISGILELSSQRNPEAVSLFEKIRAALLKQTHGPGAGDALSALKYFDPATTARECLSVALDKRMDKDARTTAIALLEEAPKPWPIRDLLPLVNETPDKDDSFLSVGYRAAQTVGRLCKKLDRNIPHEAETLKIVRKTFDDMLTGPRAAVAVEGLTEMSDDCR